MLTDNRPLTTQERKKLDKSLPYLQENLYVNSLLDPLLEAECISKDHMEDIQRAWMNRDRIRRLIDIMARRSFAQYNTFLRKLCDTKQEFVADALQSDGG